MTETPADGGDQSEPSLSPISYNRPFVAGKELFYIAEAVLKGQLAGNGSFTRRCQQLLERSTGAKKVLLTHSCTSALELAALLCELGPGDEVIMPSYTFVTTASAFALRGAKPVFVDVRPDTLNLDETKIEAAITPRTKAIVPVHYAGVACEMDTILAIAARHGLRVIEDAAQGVEAAYKGRALGTLGDLGCWSFHETKNLISGEGGALAINDPELEQRAEILWEKGTDRSRFARGEVDRYTWQELGSSFPPSELVAAFLAAQLEQAAPITKRRAGIYQRYAAGLADLGERGLLRLPIVPEGCQHNAHLFQVLLRTPAERDGLLAFLRERGIAAVFHYVPLHTSPYARRAGYYTGSLPVTEDFHLRLARLPCYYDLSPGQQQQVIDAVHAFFESTSISGASPGPVR